MKLFGKKFIFGIVMGVCASIVTIINDYPPEVYISLVGTITGLFMVAQGMADQGGK